MALFSSLAFSNTMRLAVGRRGSHCLSRRTRVSETSSQGQTQPLPRSHGELAPAVLDSLTSRTGHELRKMNRNNYFHEANGNHVQIQEKKNETGKGGSHF